MRLGLWPSTPDSPGILYSQTFLQWAVAFQLECHVSLLGFCEAVRWKNQLSIDEVYRVHMYKFIKYSQYYDIYIGVLEIFV